MMKIRNSKYEIRKILQGHIQKFGHRPEHQLYLYLYDVDPGYELVYFDFGEDGGIVGHRKGKRWHLIDEPLSPARKRVFLVAQAAEYIFAQGGANKASFEEWTDDFREEFRRFIKKRNLPYRLLRPALVQYSPVIDLEKLEGNLVGGHLKGLRYVQNRFLRNKEVRFEDAARAPKRDLLKLLEAWAQRRTAPDAVWAPDYGKFVNSGFPGCDIKRALYIDGKLRGLSAGWRIPNSDNYYIYLDIHDYSDEYLGEFVSLDHILEAKRAGYKKLDFGGSDKPLLNFKKKFHPVSIYKTYNFSITET